MPVLQEHEMELAAVGIAVAGWLAGHLLAIRAQRQGFINQIRNDARKQIGKALREYSDWCSTVAVRIRGLASAFLDPPQAWPEVRWLQLRRELNDLFWINATSRWEFVIEETKSSFQSSSGPGSYSTTGRQTSRKV
jgi:hypothetical protein